VLPREVDVLTRAALTMMALAVLLAACGNQVTMSAGAVPSSGDTQSAQCPLGRALAPPGPPWQERPDMYEPSFLPAAMDTRTARIVVLQPRATVVDEPVTWTFDVCRNTWQRMSADVDSDVDMALLVYHAAEDVTLALPRWEGTVRAYSAADDAWTELPTRGRQPSVISDVAYDPDTPSVIGWSDQSAGLWSFDLARRTWTQFARRPGDPWPDLTSREIDDWIGYTLLTYDTVRDAVLLVVFPVGGRRGSTWEFDVGSGRWTDLRSTPPAMMFSYMEMGTEIAYDSAHGTAVVASGGDVALFDSRTGAWVRPSPERWRGIVEFDTSWAPWEIEGQEFAPYGLPAGPLARYQHSVVYDPASERVVLLGGNARMIDHAMPADLQYGWWLTADAWAYDVGDNTWTQLVTEQEPLVMAGTNRPTG
jgi:hypothetical protein